MPQDRICLFFVGTAGSGKSTLVASFSRWMKDNSYDAVSVNLDPGAESIPYIHDFDIREKINLRTIMSEYSLGPNGAQIAAADKMIFHLDKMKKEIDAVDTDYILIDTPGQIELFAYRQSSREIVLKVGEERSCLVFLYDPLIAKQPTGFASLSLLAASVNFRFNLPMIKVIAKADILSEEELNTILSWSEEPYCLREALESSGSWGMHSNLAVEQIRSLEELGVKDKLYPVSSIENYGMEDIYNIVQQVFFGGEDIERR